MADQKPQAGTITWCDLTVPDAGALKEFYQNVVGWKSADVDMGGYNDFTMLTPDGKTAVAGICHHRGTNEGIPPQWMVYINVADLDQSVKEVEGRGGTVILGPKNISGYGRYCLIKDPAGAVCALFQPAQEE